MIRQPAVAGMFYPSNKEILLETIKRCFLDKKGPGEIPKIGNSNRVVGVVSPHAGYMYSGFVAAYAYREIAIDRKPETAVIIGPNHHGIGTPVAIMRKGKWKTPLGEVEIDEELATEIMINSSIIREDEVAHRAEHSIEVQIPFLQFLYPDIKIVPICVLFQDLHSSISIGEAIGEACKDRNTVIIASSDFTHYEPYNIAYQKDKEAIEKIVKMDEEAFISKVIERNISICGVGPIISLIRAAKIVGAKEAKLLNYQTSGDITGDYYSVVGYAAISFRK